MEKPTSLIIEETKKSIIDIVNKSGLPLFINETILKDIYLEVSNLYKQLAQKEKQEYLSSIEQEYESKES